MKRLIFLMLALLVAGSASAATKVQVMTDGVIDVDRLPTISFFQEADPAAPELGQIWWNNATNQLKVAGALGVYAFNSTSFIEWDTTPEAFAFTDVENATTSTVYISAPITVSGINWPAAISVSGDASAKYSINSATATAASGTVASGDKVRAVVTSSASDGTAVNATVTIGGVSDAFGVVTAEATGGGEVACSGTFTDGDNESFEAGANAICTAGFTNISGMDTYSADWANCGTHSLNLKSGTWGVNPTVDMSAMTTKYFRFYLNPSDLVSSGTYEITRVFRICGSTSGGHPAAYISLRRGNTTQYQLVTPVTGFTEVAISPSEPLLCEIKIVYNGADSVNTTYRVKKFSGGSWATLIDDAATDTGVGLPPRYVILSAGAGFNIYIDDLRVGDDWVGAQSCE